MSDAPLEARERLLRAAIQEFALHGYDHGTVRRICSRADVNVNAVKYYFTDKRGLYVEAVKEAHRARARFLGKPDRTSESTEPGDAQTRLQAFIGQMVSMALAAHEQTDHNHLLMFRELAEPSEATQHIVREFIRPHFNRLNEILMELLPPETPEFDRHLLAFSVVGQCMHYKMAGPIISMLIPPQQESQLDVPRVAEHIFRVIWAAIGEYQARYSSSGT